MLTTSRLVYPAAVIGLVAAGVLNALTWLPIDVSGFTPVWVVLLLAVFPVWFAVVWILRSEFRSERAGAPRRRWFAPVWRPSWRRVFVEVSPLVLVAFVPVVAYVAINFMATIPLLPGQPETAGGKYWFNSHGRQIATDYGGYLAGLRYQMRIFTGHPMIFFGVAALVTYGRRRTPGIELQGSRP